ncbi:hypothetical protein, partial [Polaromonas sp.]|uniref:hypothetical protein n=1 Tax=Polaromonas sp. TaxID=1869339 RepID=UPI00286B1EDA
SPIGLLPWQGSVVSSSCNASRSVAVDLNQRSPSQGNARKVEIFPAFWFPFIEFEHLSIALHHFAL